MISSPGAAVTFEHVTKSFGAKQVLQDVTFNVHPGEALCILGRSGTGKSVTLKLIVSLRAALNSRTGNETIPKVRWPFQTLDAIIAAPDQQLPCFSQYYKAQCDFSASLLKPY